MRYASLTLALFICMFIFAGCGGHGKKPEIKDAYPLIEEYLTAQKAKTCSGDVTIDSLRVNRVGDFSKEFGGWPVYSDFEVTCHSDSITTTWKSTDDGKTMTALIRQNASGKYECFIPEMFQQAQDMINNMDFNKKP